MIIVTWLFLKMDVADSSEFLHHKNIITSWVLLMNITNFPFNSSRIPDLQYCSHIDGILHKFFIYLYYLLIFKLCGHFINHCMMNWTSFPDISSKNEENTMESCNTILPGITFICLCMCIFFKIWLLIASINPYV